MSTVSPSISLGSFWISFATLRFILVQNLSSNNLSKSFTQSYHVIRLGLLFCNKLFLVWLLVKSLRVLTFLAVRVVEKDFT